MMQKIVDDRVALYPDSLIRYRGLTNWETMYVKDIWVLRCATCQVYWVVGRDAFERQRGGTEGTVRSETAKQIMYGKDPLCWVNVQHGFMIMACGGILHRLPDEDTYRSAFILGGEDAVVALLKVR